MELPMVCRIARSLCGARRRRVPARADSGNRRQERCPRGELDPTRLVALAPVLSYCN